MLCNYGNFPSADGFFWLLGNLYCMPSIKIRYTKRRRVSETEAFVLFGKRQRTFRVPCKAILLMSSPPQRAPEGTYTALFCVLLA